jgi:hypothetical protein
MPFTFIVSCYCQPLGVHKTFTENQDGLKKNCLRIKAFKIESWNFQYLFETELLETSKISTHSDNCYFHFRLSWNFFHELLFQTGAESVSFVSWKRKKVLFLKKYFWSHVNIKTKKPCLLTQFSGTVLGVDAIE